MNIVDAPHVTGDKPTIVVDVSPLFEDLWTGIPIFTRRLVQALMRHGGVDVEFAFQMTQIPKETVLAAIRAGTGTFMRGDFERRAGKSFELIAPGSHVFFPSVKECTNRSHHEASTVHDISTLVMPEYHNQENVKYHMESLAQQLATDEVVFCVSEATKAALTLAYPSAAPKVRVISQYVDWPESFEAMERNLPPPFAGRYAAVIGTVEPRKNLALLIRALAEPQVRDSDIRFVIMGKQGWKDNEIVQDLTPSERARVIFMGYVTEFTKYRLLRHCEFLVYPSLYEGFGIPALEAMSLGKPVLAARTSSFPEIVGDAGVYFDPLSVPEFAKAFEEISSEVRRSDLARKALSDAVSFNWRRLAEPVVAWVTESNASRDADASGDNRETRTNVDFGRG